MSEEKLTVVPFPADWKKHEDAAGSGSGIPPPGSHLTTTGRRLYSWICNALIADGRKIDAAGIQIVMIVHTFLSFRRPGWRVKSQSDRSASTGRIDRFFHAQVL